MNVLVLGYGTTGSVIARDLAETSGADIVVADKRPLKTKQLANELRSEKATAEQIDVTDNQKLSRLLRRGFNVVVNSTFYQFNVNVMRAAIENGVHYVDLGGLYNVTLKQLELNDKAEKAGVTALLGCGCAPGITNILAMHGANKLEKVESVYMYSGAVVFKQITGVKVAYAVPTLLDELTLNAYPFQNSKYVEVPPLSHEETVSFPEPIGDVKAYIVIHSELATIPRTIDKGIKNAIFKIIISPASVSKLKVLDEVGLTSKEDVAVKGVSISPREFLERYFSSFARPEIKKGDEVHVVRVEVAGEKDGKETRYTFDVINDPKPEWNASSSGFVTGVSASIITQMLARGDVQPRGVLPSEACIKPDPFIRELTKRGIRIRER
ncbi:MAG: saccharopine dehydrogenase NADP-binding domain-containing protein [Candidatus Bathyarchaeota archaeon]|nr:MAG: saccharopine dehydrogenase NADP-binding domain-containing protein [Candidatus Bathyarchaeota archaeon]